MGKSKKNDEPRDKRCKVSVGYERKVKSPISQYDNISHNIQLELDVEFKTIPELEAQVGQISNKGREFVEKEIMKTMAYLLEVSEDEDNQALVGAGRSLEYQKFMTEQFGKDWKKMLGNDTIGASRKKVEKLEEVDMED